MTALFSCSMVKFSLLFPFLTSLLFFLVPFSNSLAVESEALLEFKSQLNDPLSHLGGWNASISPCQFSGITCDTNTGEVIGISLANLSLSGKISPSISYLHSLNSLDLGSNGISGTIPPELANCTNLKLLNLSCNSLTGQLPDLSVLRNLLVLDLSSNAFSGRFPTWVGKLTGLVQLGLAANNFKEGEIPESIGNLKNLTWLFMAQCNFIGEIPDSIFELTSLGTLDFSFNQISGDFPKAISKLHNLYKIELYYNNLTGEIPLDLANLTQLREFDISHNQMTGKLPAEIGNLKKLTVFQIYQNNFWGEFPIGFGDMKFLTALSIYENNFSGEFPANIGRFSPLNSIDISENNFSGEFPRYLCQNNNLQFLLALDNNFLGEFPDSYADCKTLQRFRISQNFFTGRIPDGLWGLPSAVIIDVSDNGFIGGITPDIGISTTLSQLYVQNNRFSGELPAELGKLSQLQKFLAFNNSFSGPIPPQLGNLNQLTSLHLEVNSLSGCIPEDLGMCSRLVDLDLAQNALSGDIPGTLTVLMSLNSLNLSHNMFSGSIPDGLQSLKLSSIDFSRNQLSGRVPPGLLTVAGDEAFSGNPTLCVNEKSGSQVDPGLGICSISHNREKISGNRLVILSIIVSAMAILFAGLVFVSYKNFKFEESHRERDLKEGMDKETKWILEPFHPNELHAKEICNLDEDNLIGSGGTGKVYRLDLDKNRGTVAVKQLWKGKGSKDLMAEINILRKIKHRNILKLYACLTRGDLNFLVFEYMPNGNLFQALHHNIKGGKTELDWTKRHKIAVGAAKGLMYLHHDCSPAIIHRDVKSSNILLDEEYEAKIADFGIAKVAEDSDLSCFAGTHGYIAPEFAYSLKVTEKGDIYSFGVVLLELLTGCSPTEPRFGDGKDIVYWILTHLDNETVAEVFDPRLSSYSREDMIKVLRIAILCTAKLPSQRPTMREVVNMLLDADPCNGLTRAKNHRKNC